MDKITITKITRKDRENISILSELSRREHEESYTRLPPPQLQYCIDFFCAKERPTHRNDFYLLTDTSTPVGYVRIRTNKITDRNQMYIHVYIIPEYRNRGIAKQTIRELLPEIPGSVDIITTKVVTDRSSENSTISNVILDIGGKKVYTEGINVSRISEFDTKEVKLKANELRRQAEDAGYHFLFVEGGRYKEITEIDYQQFLFTVKRIWNDMPIEDANWEEEPISEEIYNAIFENIHERKGTHWSLLAIENDTNDVVGLTEVYFYKTTPHEIHQGDTGVVAEHRGKKLGKTLKYQMLNKILENEWSLSPEYWITTNAGSNVPMLRINEELLYQTWYNDLYYEIPRSDFLNWLNSE